MRLFIITSLFVASISFANNSLIESKDINVPSERDEVISQGITSGEEIKSSVLNKKIDSLNLKKDQFRPAIFTNLPDYSDSLTTNASYSTTTSTLLTIEKLYDSSETYLQIDLNYYLRLFGTNSSGAACTVEVLFNGVSCDIFQTFYKNVQDASIQIHSLGSQCMALDKGTYNITLKKTRGNLGGGYYAGNCYFFSGGWGGQSLRVIEAKK